MWDILVHNYVVRLSIHTLAKVVEVRGGTLTWHSFTHVEKKGRRFKKIELFRG